MWDLNPGLRDLGALTGHEILPPGTLAWPAVVQGGGRPAGPGAVFEIPSAGLPKEGSSLRPGVPAGHVVPSQTCLGWTAQPLKKLLCAFSKGLTERVKRPHISANLGLTFPFSQ